MTELPLWVGRSLLFLQTDHRGGWRVVRQFGTGACLEVIAEGKLQCQPFATIAGVTLA